MRFILRVFAYIIGLACILPPVTFCADDFSCCLAPRSILTDDEENEPLMASILLKKDARIRVYEGVHKGRVKDQPQYAEVPIIPLREITAQHIKNDYLLFTLIVVKIAEQYHVNALDLCKYIIEEKVPGLDEREKKILYATTLLRDTLRKIGSNYEVPYSVDSKLSVLNDLGSPSTFEQLKGLEKALSDRRSAQFRIFVESLYRQGNLSPTTGFRRYPAQFFFARDEVIPRLIEHKKKLGEKKIHVVSLGCSYGYDLAEMGQTIKEILGDDAGAWTVILEARDINHAALQSIQAEYPKMFPKSFVVKPVLTIFGDQADLDEIARTPYDILIYRTVGEYLAPVARQRLDQALNAAFLFVDGWVQPDLSRYTDIFSGIFQSGAQALPLLQLTDAQKKERAREYIIEDMVLITCDLVSESPAHGDMPHIRALAEKAVIKIDENQKSLSEIPHLIIPYVSLEDRFPGGGLFSFEEYADMALNFEIGDTIDFRDHIIKYADNNAGITSGKEFAEKVRRAIKAKDPSFSEYWSFWPEMLSIFAAGRKAAQQPEETHLIDLEVQTIETSGLTP